MEEYKRGVVKVILINVLYGVMIVGLMPFILSVIFIENTKEVIGESYKKVSNTLNKLLERYIRKRW